jgi:hypothetical protein
VLGVQHAARVNFGDQILFLGHGLSRSQVRQGDKLHLRLYWQPLRPLEENYASFVQLFAPPYYAQSHLSAGNWHPSHIPTSRWSPELYVRDEQQILIPPDIPPVEYHIRVGLFDMATGERLVLPERPGRPDSLDLGPLRVLRSSPLDPSQTPNPLRAQLGEGIELLGYALEPAALRPGEDLQVVLYWRARAEVKASYTVFVHLIDAAEAKAGQHDGQPMEGLHPTTNWQAGEVVEDGHSIAIAPDASPGRYRLAVGMYQYPSLERLPVVECEGATSSRGRILLPQAIDLY